MRRNYPTRRIKEESYDEIFVFRPDRPEVWKFINHARKLIQINLDGEYGGEIVDIWEE